MRIIVVVVVNVNVNVNVNVECCCFLLLIIIDEGAGDATLRFVLLKPALSEAVSNYYYKTSTCQERCFVVGTVFGQHSHT